MKLLYGMILQPSTAQSLAEKWISSLPDSLANRGQMLENYRKPKTTVGYGMTLKESFARLDLDSSSWKMLQVSLMGELTPFLGPWPQSGSMLNGVVSKSPKLAETITETEFLSLDIYPTPTASQITTEGTTRLYRNLFLNGVLTLEEAMVMNGNYNPLNKKGSLQMWSTPTARDWKDNGKSPSELNRNSDTLSTQAGGKLNPQFVEWLMGWPIGWTDLEHVGTESFLIKRIEHLLNSSQEQSKGGI